MKSKKAKLGYDWNEVGKQGCMIGVVLWCSSIFYLSLTNNVEGAAAFLPWMVPAFLAYAAAGVLLVWLFFYKKRIAGLSAVYWTAGMGFVLVGMIALQLADWIRYMLLVNGGVLVCIFAGNYYLLGRLAKKLNGSRMPLTLCIPLKDKPASREDFFVKFEEYCAKERIDMHYETKDLPAIVWMDGQRCEIRLDSEPGLGGAEYYINCVMNVTKL